VDQPLSQQGDQMESALEDQHSSTQRNQL
jgi:hypothetical protein